MSQNGPTPNSCTATKSGGFEIGCQACSSPSSASAAFNSSVSKPSVNQPYTEASSFAGLWVAPEASGFTRVRVACSAAVAVSVSNRYPHELVVHGLLFGLRQRLVGQCIADKRPIEDLGTSLCDVLGEAGRF